MVFQSEAVLTTARNRPFLLETEIRVHETDLSSLSVGFWGVS